MKILALGLNSTKFCIHNLWASGELEMQKLGAGGGWRGVRGWSEGVGAEVGVGVGCPRGVVPWLARGPPKAGLAASFKYYLISKFFFFIKYFYLLYL